MREDYARIEWIVDHSESSVGVAASCWPDSSYRTESILPQSVCWRPLRALGKPAIVAWRDRIGPLDILA
jgi:hypothetical protein